MNAAQMLDAFLEGVARQEQVRQAAGRAERKAEKLARNTAPCDGVSPEATRAWIRAMDQAMETLGQPGIVEMVQDTSRGTLHAELHTYLHAEAANHQGIHNVPWIDIKARVRGQFLNVNEVEALRTELNHVRRGVAEGLVMFARRFRDRANHAYLPATRNADQHKAMIGALFRGLADAALVKELLQIGVPHTIDDALTTLHTIAERQEVAQRFGVQEPMDVSAIRQPPDVGNQMLELVKAITAGLQQPEEVAPVATAPTPFPGYVGPSVAEVAAEAVALINSRQTNRKPAASSKPSRSRSTNQDRWDDGLPEWNEAGMPRCYRCSAYGHFSRGCPKSGSRKASGN